MSEVPYWVSNNLLSKIMGEKWEDITPLKIDGWQTISTKSGDPSRAVEIVGINKSQEESNVVGVRSTGSALDRQIEILKGEDGGHTANRFFVTTDEHSGVSLFRDSEDVQYFLTFCFKDAVFNERWDRFDSSNQTIIEDEEK